MYPAACAVSERAGRGYRGETAFPFVLQNLHRYFLYLALFFIGAFANHANYVIIHDATHNLIFRNKSWNKLVGILADLPNLNPIGKRPIPTEKTIDR